jgi:hypothetical protein
VHLKRYCYRSGCHAFVTEVNSTALSKPFIPRSPKRPPTHPRVLDVDVAARFFVYKLYDTTRGTPVMWQPVLALGEAAGTVSRAVERGWVIVRDEGTGRAKQACATLTDAGKLLARKGLR